jgi:hypothetical protein
MPFGGFSVMVTFRNHKALFLWAFMALYIGLVAAMSYVLILHGPPEGYSVASTITIMTVFWIGGDRRHNIRFEPPVCYLES